MEPGDDPPIVGIGASAGGIGALQMFFEALPAEPNAAFVVVIHLDPDFKSQLANILANHTSMPVVQVDATVHVQNNHVYVIAPNRALFVADHTISTLPFEQPRGMRAPIDLFFRTLAEHHGDGFAVVLTGAGADGASGVKAIKAAGGIVLVQDPSEAEFASMPRSAIATEAADFVLPVRGLAQRLAEMLKNRPRRENNAASDDDENVIDRILAHVRARVGHDFSQYKRATIGRRIARRAQITRRHSLAEYNVFLRENADEVRHLFSDFLISVTTFFRDPKTFEMLARVVIPRLFDDKGPNDKIRAWIPGCATGEEAYTIAMLLLEESERRETRPEVQVFGSDLDQSALAFAREGRFPVTIEADVSEGRMRRFFQREDDHYAVRRELREVVLFANHSLSRDPPFSRLDLISCRNLLIYLDRELQQQVCNTFHYALNRGGYLFLGASESVDELDGLFRILDRETRIYQSVPAKGDSRPRIPVLFGSHLTQALNPTVASVASPPGGSGDAALHRQMLEKIAPPSMLVDEMHRAVHLSDNAGRFLQPAGGTVSIDAVEMVRPELRFELRAALHRALESDGATLSMPIPVRFNGTRHLVYLRVNSASQGDDKARYALVMFIEGETVDATSGNGEDAADVGEPEIQKIRQLQEELQQARDRLRLSREASEATTRDLRIANEELQSTNEEYRSTLEELETSKEEIQSINEELQTVNSELKLKLETLSRAHGDLQNLMAATDVGTLFLDLDLRIRLFTPPLTKLFNVTANDPGRPITDFTHQLGYDGLADDALEVLRDLTPIEHEVQSQHGGWYLVRIRPYRMVEDKIDGVVMTFVDITSRRHAEAALRDSERQLRQEIRLVNLSRSPIFVWDLDDGILEWNRGSEELYGYTRDEAIGKRKDLLLRTTVPGSSFAALRLTLIEQGTWSGELLHKTKDDRVLTVESQIEYVPVDERRLVLESTRDVTEQKRWENRRQHLLRELAHRVSNSLAVVQAMARQTLNTARSNAEFVELFEGRLNALAIAHKLLVESHWEGVTLNAVARAQLAGIIGKDPEQLRIEGEAITLPSEAATPFGLVLHELADNATKYGALSTPGGHVALTWTLETLGDQRTLRVKWEESGGPAVTHPDGHGFGGTLIERGLPGAVVRRDFAPGGLMCTIELKLPHE